MMGGSGAGDATSIIQGGGNSLTETSGQQNKGRSETVDEELRQKALKAEQCAPSRRASMRSRPRCKR